MPQCSDVIIVDVIISFFHLNVMIDRWHAGMIVSLAGGLMVILDARQMSIIPCLHSKDIGDDVAKM